MNIFVFEIVGDKVVQILFNTCMPQDILHLPLLAVIILHI
jgi:hypothetical protein